MIIFENIGVRYDIGPEILSDVSFSLQKHSFHFLTGPSGAGKTTLLKLMFLSLKPTRGFVSLFGKDAGLTERWNATLEAASPRAASIGAPSGVSAMALQLVIGNKNYSSWSMRPWVLMRQAGHSVLLEVPLSLTEAALGANPYA